MRRKQPMGEIVEISDIPRRQRTVVPRAFQVLDAWPEAEQAMESNLIGVGKAYVFTIPKETMDEYGFETLRAVARPIKKFVKTRYKNKYRVLAHNTAQGPTIIICRPK